METSTPLPETDPTKIPGFYAGAGEPTYGQLCPGANRGCTIPTDEYRYLLDKAGGQTPYIRRTAGRPVQDIAKDLSAAIDRFRCYEWATLGQAYKYSIAGCSPTSECPEGDVIVYVTAGGSEGHLVYVAIKEQLQGAANMTHTIYMVKTLSGVKAAQRIATRLATLLGVL